MGTVYRRKPRCLTEGVDIMIAYYKLYSTWQGREILQATATDEVSAAEYMARIPNMRAVPVYINQLGGV